MIVNAAARFGCRHRFVVTDEGGTFLFVCEGCGHRTDELPIQLTSTRGQIVPFPRRSISTHSPAPARVPAARSARTTHHRG